MRFPTARFLFPMVLAVPVTAAGADTPPAPYHRHQARPVASSSPAPAATPERQTPPPMLATPLPAAVPAPPAQLATPAPVAGPDAKPPAQTLGVGGVPPPPNQTR